MIETLPWLMCVELFPNIWWGYQRCCYIEFWTVSALHPLFLWPFLTIRMWVWVFDTLTSFSSRVRLMWLQSVVDSRFCLWVIEWRCHRFCDEGLSWIHRGFNFFFLLDASPSSKSPQTFWTKKSLKQTIWLAPNRWKDSVMISSVLTVTRYFEREFFMCFWTDIRVIEQVDHFWGRWA